MTSATSPYALPVLETPRQTRFDVDAAKARYVALGAEHRSYRRIAAEYGVSEKTIQKWARRQDWPAAAAKADNQAARKMLAAAERSMEERARRTRLLHDAASDQLYDRVMAQAVEDAVLARIRADTDREIRLTEGQATEISENPQLVAFVRGIIEWLRTVSYVPAEEPRRALAELGELVTLEEGEAA